MSARLARRVRARAVAAVAAAVLGLALSACGGLPSGGPVHQGLGVDGPYVDSVRMLPDGPFPGDDRGQVVRGFLRAGAGFDDDHVVARSFLTPAYARSWQPGSDVSVLGDESVRTTTDGDTVTVRASVVATIDGAGQYRELHVKRPLSAMFRMQRVRGQWRIAGAPRQLGLWLSTSDLQRLYRAFAIYYAAPGARVLVPDLRWLPLGPGLATSLARAQLAPVPDYLRSAVLNGVPDGTQLALDAVPVQAGVATVDLATPGLSADPRLRQALWGQFIATLTQAQEVTQVSLEAGGSTVALPGMHDYPSSPGEVGYALGQLSAQQRSMVLRVGTKLQRTSDDGAGPDSNADLGKRSLPALPQVAAGWIGLALSADGLTLAAMGGDRAGLAVWHGPAQTVAPRFARQLTRPCFDPSGWLWTSGISRQGSTRSGSAALKGGQSSLGTTVYAMDSSAANGSLRPMSVAAPWLAGRTVTALRVSADGQRVALVTRRADGSDVRVQVSGIVRGSDGRPRSLDEPLRVGVPVTAATDLTWVDDRTLAVLGRVSGSAVTRPVLVSIGSGTVPLAPVRGARTIASSGDTRGILVTTVGSQVYEHAGSGWALQGKGTDVAVAGN